MTKLMLEFLVVFAGAIQCQAWPETRTVIWELSSSHSVAASSVIIDIDSKLCSECRLIMLEVVAKRVRLRGYRARVASRQGADRLNFDGRGGRVG